MRPGRGIREDMLEVTGTGVGVPPAEEAGQVQGKPRAASRSGPRWPEAKGHWRKRRGPDPWASSGTLRHHNRYAKAWGAAESPRRG